MYPLFLLLHGVSIILVELRRVPWPRGLAPVLPLACRLERREDGRTEGGTRQLDEFVPVSYNSQLLEDMSEGTESSQSDFGD